MATTTARYTHHPHRKAHLALLYHHHHQPSSQPSSHTNKPTSLHSKKSDAPTNPRGIPYAPFVDAVSDYCTTRAEVEPTLKSFSEMIQKYQFMEVNTSRRASGLREKIPDIAKTLDTVQFLKTRDEGAEELEAYFELNDTLFAKAKVPKTEEVYLWLGANVMLAYPMEEAEVLLEGKLEAAKSGLENAEEDMDFLREQITVSFLSSVLSLLGLEVCVDMDQG
jgi:prefoldin subunit 5